MHQTICIRQSPQSHTGTGQALLRFLHSSCVQNLSLLLPGEVYTGKPSRTLGFAALKKQHITHFQPAHDNVKATESHPVAVIHKLICN